MVNILLAASQSGLDNGFKLEGLFDPSLPDVEWPALPGSFYQTLGQLDANDTQVVSGGILSLLVILKLLIMGHPRSRSYYDELCQNESGNQDKIEECEQILYKVLRRFVTKENDDSGDQDLIDPEVLDTLELFIAEMNWLESNPGEELDSWFCSAEMNDLFKGKCSTLFLCQFFFKNGTTPALFVYFQAFQINNTIMTANKCEKMSCPSSLRCQDLSSQPLQHESSPITTRPGFPLPSWSGRLRGCRQIWRPTTTNCSNRYSRRCRKGSMCGTTTERASSNQGLLFRKA